MSQTERGEIYWVRVSAPHFVAALKIENDRCIASAPILNWAIGQSATHVFPAEGMAGDPPP